MLRTRIGFLQDATFVFSREMTTLGFHDDFGVRHLQYGLTITRTGIDWTVRHGLGSFSAPYTK